MKKIKINTIGDLLEYVTTMDKASELITYIHKLEKELKIITKDFEKIFCENQELKQELDKLKENRI